jgi:uncharacterized protein YidB (DUF937 family)
MSPITIAILGLLAYRAMKGKGGLADMMGKTAGTSSAGGGLGGLLAGLFGAGAAGSMITAGLSDLLKQFQENGQGDKAASWISNGPNKSLSAAELEEALGPERIAWLLRETGISREKLLTGLSRELPEVVSELTPDGRIPSEQEAARTIGPEPAR